MTNMLVGGVFVSLSCSLFSNCMCYSLNLSSACCVTTERLLDHVTQYESFFNCFVCVLS